MLKSELITEIEARVNGTVIDQGTADTHAEYNTYNFSVKIVNGLVSNVINVPVIVYDEGGAEDAYYRDKLPVYPEVEGTEPLKTTYWRDLVATQLDTLVQGDTVLTYRIDWVDEDRRIAKVTGYVDFTGNVEEREYLVYENKSQAMAYAQIVVA